MRFSPDPLPQALADALALARPRLGRVATPLLYFSTISSTNDVAAALAAEGQAEGAVVIAEAQSDGRGRRGRRWFSPPAGGLYVSVVLDPSRAEAARRASTLLTLAAGVALAEGVQAATGLRPHIKWPNDLVIGRRKLAGILAEAVSAPESAAGIGWVVLGYGINVGMMTYPPELADRATSLELELGRHVDRARLFVETLAALARRYDDLLAGRFDAILDAWLACAPMSRGARVAWETAAGGMSGLTAGIDDSGALLVRVGDQTERLVAGEVHWL